jgi:peptidoglycan hydrolase CwlO-like protein
MEEKASHSTAGPKQATQAAHASRTSLEDLRKRGVKKVKVLTPDKVRELINRRASDLVTREKTRIIAEAQAKIRPLTGQNRELREKLEALTGKLEATQKLLESERTKSFQQGAESQKPTVERYQDQVLALKTRIKELEEDNRAMLKQRDEQVRDALTQYREQIAQLAEDIKRVRTPAPGPETPPQLGKEILKQFQSEILQLRQQISSIANRDKNTSEKMKQMVTRMEKGISERIKESINGLKTKDKAREPVLAKEVILDNLFKDLPETNIGAMKVRQNNGQAIDDNLEKLKGFHEGREGLELPVPESE